MENIKSKSALEVLKTVLIAVILNLAFVLLFAALLKVLTLSDGAIKIVNQVAKVVIILVSCLVSVKSGKALWKCAVAGFVVMVLSYFIFNLLSHGAIVFLSLLTEAIFGLVVGIISGVIVAMIRK